MSLPIRAHLYEIFNKTNFSNSENIESMYRNILTDIYESSYEESKVYLIILITILLICAFIGSIANLLVICIFNCIFSKNSSFAFESKFQEASIESANLKKHSEDEKQRTEETIKLEENFLNMKNQLIFNSSSKLFYKIIRYLAIVDLFTCSFAIPVTTFEIWNNMRINEFYCKLFEFIRAIGVIASNFIIVLIAVERYMALYNLRNLKSTYLYLRTGSLLLVTALIGIVCMLQVSVYQRVNSSSIYVGICLKSEILFNKNFSRMIDLLVTSIFIIGLSFVSIIYIIIFKKIFELSKRCQQKKNAEIELLRTSGQTNTEDIEIKCTNETLNDGNFFCISCNPNLRLAITILFLTFIYYLSIIPWCLTINKIINYNPYIHYTFLLNNTINPFIYGFLNPNFRSCGYYIFKLAKRTKF